MSLIDFGTLTEPAKILVERVSDLIGGALRPAQIRRIAAAEADAKIISTVADLQAESLRRRTAQRWLAEEEDKQRNMEAIATAAIPQITAGAQPDKIERDWLVNFFDKSRLTSDEDMQQLWAKILAGEANAPGKFSKRTVNLMASLDKSDAELFQSLCRFMWHEPITHRPMIVDYSASFYHERCINFDTLLHLDEIGFLTFDPLSGFALQFESDPSGKEPLTFTCQYFDERFEGTFRVGTTNLPMGMVMLSKAGIELSEICDASPIPGFVKYVIDFWCAHGVEKIEPVA